MRKIVMSAEQKDRKPPYFEIERKFLVNFRPEEWENYPGTSIIEGYLIVAEDGTEIRLRQKGEQFF